MRILRAAALCAASLVVAGAVPAAAATSDGGRTTLVGTSFFGGSEVDDGPATDLSEQTTARLWLSVRNPGQLAAEAKFVSDPKSPGYDALQRPPAVVADVDGHRVTPQPLADAVGQHLFVLDDQYPQNRLPKCPS
jgi:hypothetical protein